MTANYQVHGDIAVITLNNPPVNGLGLSTRIGITDGLAAATARPRVHHDSSESTADIIRSAC
jgi:3-hydroxyacyl-CoA dehydrogenase